ncbi:MAG: GvpL/GvpF family gas vesicle protein [Candidatus Brocadiae bacterium]|nr:GvpL/GvpF family gas vesicle protein [Candidatus Brocadiia bacterium]
MEGGFYIYAIAAAGASTVLDAAAIGAEAEQVETLPRGDIAAIVSRCRADRYEVTRANTLAHQRVMETAMESWPILPVRFDTIAESTEQIIENLLVPRHREFRELLDVMAGKVELGLKVLWADMSSIFAEIVEENHDIKAARSRKLAPRALPDAVRLGEIVKNALDRKKAREARRILRCLDRLWFDRKVNDVFGDSMILNAAFLVESEREGEFDRSVDILADDMNGRVRLKYVGPIPPCNFVEIVVTW